MISIFISQPYHLTNDRGQVKKQSEEWLIKSEYENIIDKYSWMITYCVEMNLLKSANNLLIDSITRHTAQTFKILQPTVQGRAKQLTTIIK